MPCSRASRRPRGRVHARAEAGSLPVGTAVAPGWWVACRSPLAEPGRLWSSPPPPPSPSCTRSMMPSPAVGPAWRSGSTRWPPPSRSRARSARSPCLGACGPVGERRWRSCSARSRRSTARSTSSAQERGTRCGERHHRRAGVRRRAHPARARARDPVAPSRRRPLAPPHPGGPGDAAVRLSRRCCPLGVALTETHKFREPLGRRRPATATVAFRASDGVKLSGWYRPTRNGATVIVLHGGGATGPARSRTPGCSSTTATASCSTTPAAAGAARARRTRSAGAGSTTSPAR